MIDGTAFAPFIARNAASQTPRLNWVMQVVVGRLYTAVKEIEPTWKAWLQALLFLTRPGQICTDLRQGRVWFLRHDGRRDAGRCDPHRDARWRV